MIALLITIAAQAAPVYAKGGAVGLTPPPAMREASGFAGFEDVASSASITIAELPPQAYPEIVAKLDAGGTLPTGVTLAGKGEAVTLADATPARLYRGSQTAYGTRYVKWMLIVNGKATTALVTAQVPEAGAAAHAPAIVAALKTTRLRTPPGIDAEIAALPFAIGDRAGFRPVRALMGSGLILTIGPLDTDPGMTQPIAIIASSLGAVPVADRAAVARATFAKFGNMADIAIGDERAVGGDSYRIAGTASAGGKPVALIQHMRFGAAGGYVRTMCVAPAGKTIAAQCDALAGSVTLRR